MAITRNPINTEPRQNRQVIRRTDSFDTTRRSIKLNEAGAKFEQTGNLEEYKATAEEIRKRTLGGGTEQYGINTRVRGAEEKDFGNRVAVAEQKYKETPTGETAAALKSTIESGKALYGENTEKGVQIAKNARLVDTSEMNRELADIEFNWSTDPLVYHDEYKKKLQEQINYYGSDSIDGITLRSKLRSADEEGLLSETRNAMALYETDPEANIGRLQEAQKKLVDFYGSSADGYYAIKALNSINTAEQDRLDQDASLDFETGVIGYDAYKSYLDASLAKYPEGSKEYMKYFEASKSLEFNKNLDDLIRLQFSKPQGEVMKSMKSYMGSLQPGSPAYNQVQDQVDQLEYQIRYNAYQDMIKKEVSSRQKQANDIEVKLYSLEQDFMSGAISKSKYSKKVKSYNNKLDYLTSSYTLPQFEMYNTYA